MAGSDGSEPATTVTMSFVHSRNCEVAHHAALDSSRVAESGETPCSDAQAGPPASCRFAAFPFPSAPPVRSPRPSRGACGDGSMRRGLRASSVQAGSWALAGASRLGLCGHWAESVDETGYIHRRKHAQPTRAPVRIAASRGQRDPILFGTVRLFPYCRGPLHATVPTATERLTKPGGKMCDARAMQRFSHCLLASAFLWGCSDADPGSERVAPSIQPGPAAGGSQTNAPLHPGGTSPVGAPGAAGAPSVPSGPRMQQPPPGPPTELPPAMPPPSGSATPTGAVAPTSSSPPTTTGAPVDASDATDATDTSGAGDSSEPDTTGEQTDGAANPNPMPRTECPQAPPAESKPPASDRTLAVSKDEYAQMFERMDPFEGSRGSLPWHMYTPEPAKAGDGGERFPLVVMLHGGYGREVDDGNILVDVAQYLVGSANGLLTEQNRQLYPAFILAPHCRVSEGCNFYSNEWASNGGAHFQVNPEPSVSGGTALELIRHVMEAYPVDRTRVYLTGNSMGGGGTWELAQRHPELFAAILPVSGHTPNLDQLKTVAQAKLPVWAFGAENDNVNPYSDTVAAIESLSQAGGCAWLTTYTNAGHDDDLWSSPYLEPGLWPWLFTQTNSNAP